jgi:hypothetical protein
MSKEIKRIYKNGKRYYQVIQDNRIIGKFPSVTTILSATKPEKDKQKLDEWKNRLGIENAEKVSQDAADRGTVMHRIIEVWSQDRYLFQLQDYLYKYIGYNDKELINIRDDLKQIGIDL